MTGPQLPSGTTNRPQPLPLPSNRRAILLWVVLALALVSTVLPSDSGALSLLLGEMQVVFTLVHLATWTSWRTSGAVFLSIFVVSFLSEFIGTNTGIVFGPYRYSETLLGPVVGGVPPLVMLAYVSIGYSAYVIARILVCGGAAGFRERITHWQLVVVAVLTGLLMAAMDLTFDPINSTLLGEWVWTDGGTYFGVPPHNFFGWALTGLAFTLVVGMIMARPRVAAGLKRPWPRWFMVQPVLMYAVFAFPTIVGPLLGRTGEIRSAMAMVATIVISIPVVAALARLLQGEPPSSDLAPRQPGGPGTAESER